jgi:hypothetical protein
MSSMLRQFSALSSSSSSSATAHNTNNANINTNTPFFLRNSSRYQKSSCFVSTQGRGRNEAQSRRNKEVVVVLSSSSSTDSQSNEFDQLTKTANEAIRKAEENDNGYAASTVVVVKAAEAETSPSSTTTTTTTTTTSSSSSSSTDVDMMKKISNEQQRTTTKNSSTKKSNNNSSNWQIDFCSRPLKDDRGKKVWELLITDEDRTFEHAEYFPNNRINSVELSKALKKVVDERTVVTGEAPRKVKFFRSQMMTIITRACKECDLEPLPSRRCQTMLTWLEERMESVYKKHPGYDANSAPLMTFDAQAPKALPDALRGESWAFVALPLVGVKEEMETVKRGKAFGDLLTIDPELPDDTLIPGVVVYTARAAALSGWTKGLELSAITVDLESSSIVLETGVNESWNYAFFRRTKELRDEAREWEGVKRQTKGLHFLAIQTDSESEKTDGFWILKDVKGAQF